MAGGVGVVMGISVRQRASQGAAKVRHIAERAAARCMLSDMTHTRGGGVQRGKHKGQPSADACAGGGRSAGGGSLDA